MVIQELYLAALSRFPSAAEQSELEGVLREKSSKREAWGRFALEPHQLPESFPLTTDGNSKEREQSSGRTAIMRKAGCLTVTDEVLKRRHFLKVGSLSLLGISLPHYLKFKSVMAAAGTDVDQRAKAQACIMVWLEGGPSHVDTWDPKPNSSFQPISTNVPGIQISELLPQVATHMDKLALIRSVHTEENNHGQGTHYALTGHRPTAAMQFPSLGTIVTKRTREAQQRPRQRSGSRYLEGGLLRRIRQRRLPGSGLQSDAGPRSQQGRFSDPGILPCQKR